MKIFFSKKVSSWLKYNWLDTLFTLFITVLVGFIFWKNYTPNTFLSGWDNLHPEFNYKLNIVRSLNSVWQEYQGTGLLGGMAHTADLPRQLVLWTLSVFLPISFIRYFWVFLMLFIGPLGVYFLLKDKSKFGALTASFFYIFNLATVQYFFVPFETFINFFGFLPWLIYFAHTYLSTSKKLLGFMIFSILGTCAFYVQTLFLVYTIFLVLLGIASIFKYKFKGIKRVFKLFLVTIFVNLFWLLPVIQFSITSGEISINSEINQIATPETIYMNKARSNFSDISSFKGYWFDYYDFGKDGKFDYLFKDWNDYSSGGYIKEISIGLFIISILGLVITRQFTWLILFGLGYLMLSGVTLSTKILQEAFRNSFTKWSVALSLVVSLGLGFFVTKFKKFSIIPAVFIILLSIYTVLPVFKDKFISERVKVNIPQEYFSSFNWLNERSNGGRVSYFPAFDKWGWNYHDWGYGGSGFIWYGIKNPVLDRAFNVWSPNNENYYNQITKAILNNDTNLFKSVLTKYQVSYLYLDNSIIFPWGEKELLKVDNIKSFISELGYSEVFNSGFITIYSTGINNDNFISTSNIYTLVNTDLTYSSKDLVYEKYGDYVQNEDGIGYPFANFDPRGLVDIEVINDKLLFTNKTTNSEVVLPTEDKISETFKFDRGFNEAFNCDLQKNGEVERTQLLNGRSYKATNGGVSCDYFSYTDLPYNKAYVLRIKGNNITGRSLKIYLYNWETKRVELEELLNEGEFDKYFVVYSKDSSESGYTLNVETRSFGRISAENEINLIEIVPFDIDLVSNLYIDAKTDIEKTGNLEVKDVKKYGTAIYKVKANGSGLLVLGQGFENGWLGFTRYNNNWYELKHVKVNSWANGFIVNGNKDKTVSSEVIIIFWPQLLEWGGFILLVITSVYLYKSKT